MEERSKVVQSMEGRTVVRSKVGRTVVQSMEELVLVLVWQHLDSCLGTHLLAHCNLGLHSKFVELVQELV